MPPEPDVATLSQSAAESNAALRGSKEDSWSDSDFGCDSDGYVTAEDTNEEGVEGATRQQQQQRSKKSHILLQKQKN